MNEEKKNYGAKALIPLVVFLGLYIGCGFVFLLSGVPVSVEGTKPFNVVTRYFCILLAIIVAFLIFERDKKFSEKIDIYTKAAGRPGCMQLGLILMMAGGFASANSAIGGNTSIVNLGLTLIPSQLLVPGVFLMSAIVSTCIGTSMGTLSAVLPIAVTLAQTAGLNTAMVGAACLGGAFFGDNLSMISDTTILATQGVGAEMKDKFRMNFLIALPAAVISMVLYAVLSMNANIAAVEAGEFNLLTIIPYIVVLVLAVVGVDVVLTLAIGIALSGVIGIAIGAVDIFLFCNKVSGGIEGMFALSMFAIMISGLVGVVTYYGGIDWLVNKAMKFIKGRKSCENVLYLLTILISGVICNNTVAIMLTAPIAKEIGGSYKIAPKRLASLLDIGACLVIGLLPQGTGTVLVEELAECSYVDIVRYQFYPILLFLACFLTIQFGLMRTAEEKAN